MKVIDMKELLQIWGNIWSMSVQIFSSLMLWVSLMINRLMMGYHINFLDLIPVPFNIVTPKG
jgi:hypothetical protein